ncbi:MAG: thioredoxin-disulfide reductase [Candidatus Kerfeldbacteria bacterium]|nr:thioredoxin-disulfide reductase [Candidatus Kerfeldbacteria bacterium]
METQHRKLIIIGSGPAGLTAAIYSARAELSPLVITGSQWGGQLMWTTEVENFPGFPKGIMGPQLMQEMRDQAARFGTEFVDNDVSAVDFSAKPFKLTTPAGQYTADCVIIATGASAIWLGLESEQRLRGKGVSACATCDGFFFKDKDVAVVGGGDSAMEEATFLTKFCKSVTILVRGPEVRASKYMLERAKADPKITFRFNTSVAEVLGENSVTGLKLVNAETKASDTIAVQGLFLAIGHKPDTEIFAGQIELGKKNYIAVRDLTKTSVEGVFTAGDVHDYRYRQAVTAAGSGCMAALDAEKYLHSQTAK